MLHTDLAEHQAYALPYSRTDAQQNPFQGQGLPIVTQRVKPRKSVARTRRMTFVTIEPMLRLALSANQAEKVQLTATSSEIISPK